MLIDKVRVNFSAGKGGDGGVAFEVTGKPAGGDGGKGGDIILQGSKNVYDLEYFKLNKEIIGFSGTPGGKNKRKGADGRNLIIQVPLTTTVYDLENNIIAQIEQSGQEVRLLEGGQGGLGNFYFRRGQKATLKKRTVGKKGESLQCFLELKLQADVAFVGFPNAGKSSMLNALTNTSVKVAPYPFTTLHPNLGVADNLVLLDLPGLIEGTVEGKGLGTRFMKHADYVKLVVHFISLEAENLHEQYLLIRKELSEIDEKLFNKPEIIVLTKTDLYTPEVLKERIASFKSTLAKDSKIIPASVYDYDAVNILKQELKKHFKGNPDS